MLINLDVLKNQELVIFVAKLKAGLELDGPGLFFCDPNDGDHQKIWMRNKVGSEKLPLLMCTLDKQSRQCICSRDFLPYLAMAVSNVEYERFVKQVEIVDQTTKMDHKSSLPA